MNNGNSTGKEALAEAAIKFGHRANYLADDNNEGLNKVRLVSRNFYTDGSDLPAAYSMT